MYMYNHVYTISDKDMYNHVQDITEKYIYREQEQANFGCVLIDKSVFSWRTKKLTKTKLK